MGFFDRIKNVFATRDDSKIYLDGLQRSQKGLGSKLRELFESTLQVDDQWFEQLTLILLQADVSLKVAQKLVKSFRKSLGDDYNAQEALDRFVEVCAAAYGDNVSVKPVTPGQLYSILMVGVNGSGKTTTSAKLAYHYKQQGYKVLLIAADTFRAGAVRQLQTWGEKEAVEVFAGNANADPASVIVDGTRYAKHGGFDVIICDTAGRLQNKVNLMAELAKIRKVLDRECGQVDQAYLVLDANTGQNGVIQAQEFAGATPIDSLILTKLDGSSKGGILLSIKDDLGLKVSYIGLGEGLDHLRRFDIAAYLFSLIWGEA